MDCLKTAAHGMDTRRDSYIAFRGLAEGCQPTIERDEGRHESMLSRICISRCCSSYLMSKHTVTSPSHVSAHSLLSLVFAREMLIARNARFSRLEIQCKKAVRRGRPQNGVG